MPYRHLRALRLVALGLAAAWTCLESSRALAYRPFDGTDADVAEHRELELEIGPIGFLRQGTRDALTAPSLVINYGFLPGWELVLEGQGVVQLDPTAGEERLGLLNTSLSVKHVLRRGSLQDGKGPSVAMEATALLPTTDVVNVGGELAVIVSQQWSALTLHGNAAGAWQREQRPAIIASLIAEGPKKWPVRPVMELLAEQDFGGPTYYSALAGAIWRVSDGLSFDLAGRYGRTFQFGAYEDVVEIRAGLTWAFSTVKRAAAKQ